MTVKEIDKEIDALRARRHEIEAREIEEHQRVARQHVGRCFRVNGNQYAKVIDVPPVIHTKTGVHYNQYQYPALYLGHEVKVDARHKSLVPFYEDNIFVAAWGEGDDFLNTYEEITVEEFAAEFERLLADFRNQIGV